MGNSNVVAVTISVAPVNDPPSFTLPTSLTVNPGASSLPGFATEISPGPADESSQSLAFELTGNSNPNLFSQQPALSPDGTLSFTSDGTAIGKAVLTFVLHDDGGNTTGGSAQSPPAELTLEITDDDIIAPEVVSIRSQPIRSQPSVELGECVELREPSRTLVVTFSEPMLDLAGDSSPFDVTNPLNYGLSRSGDDGEIATNISCGAAAEGDVRVAALGVTYDPIHFEATVHYPADLVDDFYQLSVCDALQDLNGNRLSDANVLFRVGTQNAFANGHFDCTLEAWAAEPQPAVSWSSDDVQDAIFSGSASLAGDANATLGLGQCLETPGPSFHLAADLRFDATVGDALELGFFCDLFSEPACAGALVGRIEDSVLLGPLSTWLPAELEVQASPTGTFASALCGTSNDLVDGSSYDLRLDRLILRIDLFSDGFESGDASAWTAITPAN